MLPSGKPKTTREPTTTVWNGNGGAEVERMRRARSHGGNGLRISLARESMQDKRDTPRPLRTHWSVCVAPIHWAVPCSRSRSDPLELPSHPELELTRQIETRIYFACMHDLCLLVSRNNMESIDRGFPPRTRI
jgi:hypothetical protein